MRTAATPPWVPFEEFGDLDAPPPPDALVAEPEPDTSELDGLLEDARSHGFLEGHSRGLAQAHADRAELARRALEAVGLAMAGADAAHAATAERAADALAGLLLSALATVLPTLCARHGAAEVAALARAVAPALHRRPDVTVEVNPGVLEALDAALATMPTAQRRRMLLTPCDAIAPGDARLTWVDGEAIGTATRDAAATWARAMAVLAECGLGPAPPSTGPNPSAHEIEHLEYAA